MYTVLYIKNGKVKKVTYVTDRRQIRKSKHYDDIVVLEDYVPPEIAFRWGETDDK